MEEFNLVCRHLFQSPPQCDDTDVEYAGHPYSAGSAGRKPTLDQTKEWYRERERERERERDVFNLFIVRNLHAASSYP